MTTQEEEIEPFVYDPALVRQVTEILLREHPGLPPRWTCNYTWCACKIIKDLTFGTDPAYPTTWGPRQSVIVELVKVLPHDHRLWRRIRLNRMPKKYVEAWKALAER
jgi:hypothetical protein